MVTKLDVFTLQQGLLYDVMMIEGDEGVSVQKVLTGIRSLERGGQEHIGRLEYIACFDACDDRTLRIVFLELQFL